MTYYEADAVLLDPHDMNRTVDRIVSKLKPKKAEIFEKIPNKTLMIVMIITLICKSKEQKRKGTALVVNCQLMERKVNFICINDSKINNLWTKKYNLW